MSHRCHMSIMVTFHVYVSFVMYSSSSPLKFKYVHLWKHTISKSIYMLMVLDVLNTVTTRFSDPMRCHIKYYIFRCHIGVTCFFRFTFDARSPARFKIIASNFDQIDIWMLMIPKNIGMSILNWGLHSHFGWWKLWH